MAGKQSYLLLQVSILLVLCAFVTPCPKGCTCTGTYLYVNCSRQGLNRVPIGIPVETRQLDLCDNFIDFIPPHTFESLVNLENLNLSGNALSPVGVSNQSFFGLTKLKSFNIQNNLLTKIPKLYSKSLRWLNVMGNNIENLVSQQFSDTPELETLLLSSNNIKSAIPYDAFKGLKSIKNIQMKSCDLYDGGIREKPFQNLSSLETLSLDLNKLRNVPPGIPRTLKSLSIAFNNIEVIPPNVDGFHMLHQMTDLDLSNNPLNTPRTLR